MDGDEKHCRGLILMTNVNSVEGLSQADLSPRTTSKLAWPKPHVTDIQVDETGLASGPFTDGVATDLIS